MTVLALGNKPSVRVCKHLDAVVPPLRTATPANHLPRVRGPCEWAQLLEKNQLNECFRF